MSTTEQSMPHILGLGTALPSYTIPQANSVAVASSFIHEDPKVTKVLPAVYRRTQVRRRASVLLEGPSDEVVQQTFYPPAAHEQDYGPTTRQRMARFQQEAGNLARRSASQALSQSGVAAEHITHLITVTCTGFYAPGFDYELITGLKLSLDVERIQVGFMGCHAVINALRAARAIALANHNAKILIVSVELCSLHYQYGGDPDSIVANALFADGCGALVVAGKPATGPTATDWPCRILDTGSRLIPDSQDAMSWSIGNHGFQMTLAATVPTLIETQLSGYLTAYLAKRGLGVGDIGGWAVHPGGPRVLGSVEKAMNLRGEELSISRDVLSQNGNMSSATLVFILQQMRTQRVSGPWLMLGFGPGLEVELALLA